MQNELSKRNLQLVQVIQQSIEEDKLLLEYQPVMDLKNPDKPMFMLTCRMQTSNSRSISYPALRQLASTTDLGQKLDRWLLINGLRKIKKLRKSDPGAGMFIPLSVATLQSEDFPSWLNRQQDLYDFPGTGMILSFRLSELSQDIRAAHQRINELHDLNMRISLTRFSEKPAALKVLQLLQAEYIEIPPKLLQADNKTIQQILRICRKLGVKVVLCGINAATEVSLEWSKGANMLMGNYIHPAEDNLKFHFPASLMTAPS